MHKKKIVVTGGAGFIGSNLIEEILKKTNYKILSVDNYSSGTKTNHVKNKRVKYLKGDTKNIFKILKSNKNTICAFFHFGEFARIHQSFKNMNKCFDSNIIGTTEVFKFCLENKIRLIYSATSATLGNRNEQNFSPYAFTKSKNLELLENFKRWFGFEFEVIYFYNVYGPKQISKGKMATVIGIFERQYSNKIPLTVVRPGTQSRKFTHISDTIKICIEAWEKKLSKHYSVSSKESYSIIEIAKMFGGRVKYLAPRLGERYHSSIVRTNLSNKIINKEGKIKIKDYIKNFKNNLL